MLKKTLILFLMVFSLAFSVIAAGNLTILPASDSATANISSVVSKNLTFTNSGNNNSLSVTLPSTFNFIGIRTNQSVIVSYNSSSPLTIANNSQKSISYSFTVPSNAFSETYVSTANFSAGNGNFGTSTFTLNVTPSPSLSMTSAAASAVRTVNSTASASFTVSNTGNTDLSINLAKTDLIGPINISSSNIVLSKTALSLNYTQSEIINVNITFPANISAGDYVGNIKATAGSSTVNSTLTLTVNNPIYSISAPSKVSFDTADRNSSVSKTFEITNNGNAPLTSINISTDASSSYNATFSPHNFTNLSIGETKTITANAFIPQNENAGNRTIGNILIKSTEFNASAIPLSIDVSGKLTIDDLDVTVDGKTDSSVNDGERIDKEAKPESTVEFDVKVKNNYPSASKIDMEDITITVTLKEIDDGDDIDLDSDSFDLDSGSSKRVSLKFDLPLEVDTGDYEVIIEVEGKDDNDIYHRLNWGLTLEVGKENHDIKIRKSSVDKPVLKCDRSANLEVNIINLGTDVEEEVFVNIRNTDLGININEGPIELSEDLTDEDSKYENMYPITIGKDKPAGAYSIEVFTYYDVDKLSDRKRAQISLEDCTEEEKNAEKTPDVKEIPEEETPEEEETPKEETTSEEKTPVTEITFKETGAYTALLVLVNIAVVSSIVLLIAKFFFLK